MRTRMIQFTGQTTKRLQKITEKNDYPSESLCNACYADRQKVSVFFFKMSQVLTIFSETSNQFLCTSHFFPILLDFKVKNTQK